MRNSAAFLLSCILLASPAAAQRLPISPGVGNAVFLATNSIQIDRDNVVVSGDVIVNNSTAGPVLGEAALSLDRGVITPAGFRIVATSIDLDSGAAAGGDAYYNTLTNQGTIGGSRFTPLALPFFAVLPPAAVRSAGSEDITVSNGVSKTLDEGAYGNLTIGPGATAHLTGGGYAFRAITIARGGILRFAAASDVVVSGRAEFGADTRVEPDIGPLSAASIRIQVDGLNGPDGALLSTPSAVHVGQGAKVAATLYATAGSMVFDQSVEATGAFLARDILIGRGGRYTLSSAFNRAPVADPQTVFAGAAPLQITLTGFDPEGGVLTFSIVSGPSGGTLSTPVPLSPASATVTYTATTPNAADAFTFRVRNHGGASGDAIVSINPSIEDPPIPPPATVVATAGSAQTALNVPAMLLLRGSAPAGVALTFSIVGSSGPFHGTLSAITQGAEVPQRSATVSYTPEAGFTGADSFQFQVCGTVSGTTRCDTALFSINVQGPLDDPPSLAHDVEVSTLADTGILISLGDNPIATGRRPIKAQAIMFQPAAVAGNVADADHNGLGDNANELPGPVPVFMSAGVNEVGGSGSNGTVRMQFEWDLSGIAPTADSIQTAQVTLPTHRGTIDSLDTFFYWAGVSGDGKLTNSDFEAPAEAISGVVMSVPQSMPVDGIGTFSFDVRDPLLAAVRNGFRFFSIQGRVDESRRDSARGLEVRTTADPNVSESQVPTLTVATPGLTPPIVYTITSLPQNGVLQDGAKNPITQTPYALPDALVTYLPASGFLGLDTFSFTASSGDVTTGAFARISVLAPDCRMDWRGCYDGR